MTELRAGWARVSLKLPARYPMTGYIARQGSSRGTLDPLYVRVLVLEQGPVRAAILVIDLLLVSATWAAGLRKLIALSIHTSAEHVIVAATHTHSGPLVDTSPFRLSPSPPDERAEKLMKTLGRQCLKATAEAHSTLRKVSVSHLHCPIHGLATDRTRHNRNPVQWMHLVRFDTPDASALLGVLPCHPTVLGAGNELYSGDLHGEVARRYEKEYDVALIANGAAANISTRFTRSSQTRAQVVRFADHVLEEAGGRRFEACSPCEISLASGLLRLPVRDLQKQPSKFANRTGRVAEVMKEGALVAQQLSKTEEFGRRSALVPLSLIRLGPVTLAAIPLELYAETGRFLWAHSRTVALCYANGYWGYVYGPNARPFDYEVLSSPFDERADALVRRAILELQQRA